MSRDCKYDDYSLLTGNTGIATISVGNSNLDGSGPIVNVITAGEHGTIIKTIIIKALQQTTTGMIRFFISNLQGTIITLFREIPIPIYPMLTSTATPPLLYPTLEIDLVIELELKNGCSLLATTQNSESFNIIAQGINWKYPQIVQTPPLPPLESCCNFGQRSSNTGLAVISNANPFLDGSGTIIQVFSTTSGTNGSIINEITIAAMQSTSINGMVRFFLSNNGGTTYKLMMEVVVPQSVQSSYQSSFKVSLNEEFYLQQGYTIGVSTQNAQNFSITIVGEDWVYPIS